MESISFLFGVFTLSHSRKNSGWFNESTEVFPCAHGLRANPRARRVSADGRCGWEARQVKPWLPALVLSPCPRWLLSWPGASWQCLEGSSRSGTRGVGAAPVAWCVAVIGAETGGNALTCVPRCGGSWPHDSCDSVGRLGLCSS